MLPQTRTCIPVSLVAGDSLIFNPTFGLYAASDGWAITYYFQTVDGKNSFKFPVTNSGTAFSVSVNAETTGQLTAANYIGIARAVLANPEQTVIAWQGGLIILPDLATANDTRSHARQTLDAIELVMSGRATDDVLDSIIEGTTIRRLPMEQLILLRDRYKAVVDTENAAQRVRDKKGTGRNIYVRIATAGGTPFAPNDSPYGLGIGGQRF